MNTLDETHDAGLTSWLESANAAGCDFPIQNLPHAVFRRTGSKEPWRGGIAIGDQVIDMAAASAAAVFGAPDSRAGFAATLAGGATLNELMSAGPQAWSSLRRAVSRALSAGSALESALRPMLIPLSEIEYEVPAQIGDYTDFYTSVFHATNIGKLFRPDAPLMPNYKWVPIGYHGRASSIAVSGQSFPRPCGQTLAPGASAPTFGPSKRMDYELELGIWIGPGNELGTPIALDAADDHVFGMCLLNDWSARDIQAWEYQPLGPFLGKNFATTISPWIVTMAALAPYRQAWTRPADDPQPLAYLESEANRASGALDIRIESFLSSLNMRETGVAPTRLSSSSFKYSYWSVAQMVTHHAIGGCNLQPGDLMGTGTQSGPTSTEAAALIELTAGGKLPVTLDNGETRAFLSDGDTVIIKAWCEQPGRARIGFGECRGTLLPARLPA